MGIVWCVSKTRQTTFWNQLRLRLFSVWQSISYSLLKCLQKSPFKVSCSTVKRSRFRARRVRRCISLLEVYPAAFNSLKHAFHITKEGEDGPQCVYLCQSTPIVYVTPHKTYPCGRGLKWHIYQPLRFSVLVFYRHASFVLQFDMTFVRPSILPCPLRYILHATWHSCNRNIEGGRPLYSENAFYVARLLQPIEHAWKRPITSHWYML